MTEIASYFDINEGFLRHIDKKQESQKTSAATVSSNLINDSTLLCVGVEEMSDCGLFEKTDESYELSKSEQTCDTFQSNFLNTEEKFLINKNIHDKKGGIGSTNATDDYGKDNNDYDFDP